MQTVSIIIRKNFFGQIVECGTTAEKSTHTDTCGRTWVRLTEVQYFSQMKQAVRIPTDMSQETYDAMVASGSIKE